MNSEIRLYRKRYIPQEIVYLKEDLIIRNTDSLIITKWDCLKPRVDIDHGVSAYFIDSGIKVSKIYNKNNEIVYWYCDIIHTEKRPQENSIIFHDLLVDVLVYENGKAEVVDIGEIAEVLEKKELSVAFVIEAMKSLDYLLNIIYSGKFSNFQNIINEAENCS